MVGERKLVLAEGESTGHAHRLEQDDCYLYEDGNGNFFLEAKNAFDLTHEEHKQQRIPKGLYAVDIVQERDHLNRVDRRVID